MTRCITWLLLVTLGCSDDPTSPGVEAGSELLPPSGAAYYGGAPHRFGGGSAQLTCSSHGQFTAAVTPPATPSAVVTADYFATFTGQLVLGPPLVAAGATYPLSLQVHMVERLTLVATQGAVRTFDTELLTFALGGGAAPGGATVRESPSRVSSGQTTVTALSGGRYRIETYYDVWLEISVDGGSTWVPADGAVRMTLGRAP